MTAKTNKREPSTIAALNRKMAAERIPNQWLATKLGVTEGAVRFWRVKRRVPKNRLVREALERFLQGGGK